MSFFSISHVDDDGAKPRSPFQYLLTAQKKHICRYGNYTYLIISGLSIWGPTNERILGDDPRNRTLAMLFKHVNKNNTLKNHIV